MSVTLGKKADRVPPVVVGQTVEIGIDRLGYRGEGVGRVEGFTVFVEGALPGELVSARVAVVARTFAQAVLLQVKTAAAERVAPPCPVFDLCGGCQLQHLSYEAQLVWKRQAIVDALVRIGHFQADDVAAQVAQTLGMDDPWRYRNHVQVAAADRGGQFVAGFVEEGTHEPVEAAECLIRPHSHDDLLTRSLAIIEALGLEGYDEATGSGDIRSLAIRTNQTGEALVVIRTVGETLPHSAELARRLAASSLPSGIRVVGVVQVAPRSPSGQSIWGRDTLDEVIMGLSFQVSATSFLQVNPSQTQVLYETALAAAQLRPDDTLWDIYCGIGTLTLLAAQHVRRAVGVEEVAAAVLDARHNAQINGLEQTEFRVGRAERVVRELLTDASAKGKPVSVDSAGGPAVNAEAVVGGIAVGEDAVRGGSLPDVVLLDPPRAGCAPEVIAALADARPERIVYLSCNPATLARDLRLLADRGYALKSVQPIDMFPQTAHVECVAVIYRVD